MKTSMTKRLAPNLAQARLGAVLLFACLCAAGAAGAQTRPLGQDELRADLAQFRKDFFDRDKSYSSTTRAEAEARLRVLEAGEGKWDSVRFSLELVRIAALADNAHSMSLPMQRADRFNRVALRLVPFGRDFHVLRARPGDADLLGARLLGIDGHPLERLRVAAHSLQGGIPAWRDRWAPYFLESPEQLHAAGLATNSDAALYQFETADGRKIEKRMPAEAPRSDRPRASTERLLLPQVGGEDLGWQGVLATGNAPWALLEQDQRLRWRHDAGRSLLVLQMRVNHDTRSQKMADWIKEAGRAIDEHRPRHLVLDLRQNGGGDLTTTGEFAKSLPGRVAGRVFVLTSPWTFSAAISTAGYVKQAAPERVTIVGEPVGDRLVFFAEGRSSTLTHSKLAFLPATERHDYQGGCKDFDDCHGPVKRHPIAVPSLAPDIAAPLTFEAYRDGIDPAMRAVEAALK